MTSPDEESLGTNETTKARKVPWLRRTRLRTIVARAIGWSFIGSMVLLAAVFLGIKVFVTPSFVKQQLIEQAARQTGGRLEIGDVQFDLLTGLRLSAVRYSPPAAGDTRGILSGGAVTATPLLTLAAFDFHYSLTKLLAGRLHVRSLQLIDPTIALQQVDEVFNFASIAAYRSVHYPTPPEAPKAPEPAKPKEPKKTALLPFDPGLVVLPLHVLLQDVGVRNLSFSLVKTSKGAVVQKMAGSGLSLEVGAQAFGRSSELWVSLLSSFEQPLRVTIEEASAAEGHKAGALVKTLAVQAATVARLSVTNLRNVKFELGTRLDHLATPAAGYRDLGAFLKVAVALTPDLNGLRIDQAALDVADALSYELAGSVIVQGDEQQQYDLKLNQTLHVDLKEAAALAKPFMPTLKAAGELDIEHLKIDGVLDPKTVKADAETGALPYVSGTLWLHDVFVDLPDTGLTMKPIVGSLAVAAGPALTGGATQVDLALDLKLPQLTTEQKTPLGRITAGVDDLMVKVTARALWPQLIVPLAKINIEATHVRAKGPQIATVDVPLFVDIDAEGRKDLQRLAVNANIELESLAELTAMADCQAACTHFRSSLAARLSSLAKLHAMALPLEPQLHLGEFMPSLLRGAVDLQLAARGKIPDPQTTPIAELIKKGDVQFSTQLNVSKLSAKVPFDQIDLKNFETHLAVNGTLSEQKLDFSQKFDSLALLIKKSAAAGPAATSGTDGPAGPVTPAAAGTSGAAGTAGAAGMAGAARAKAGAVRETAAVPGADAGAAGGATGAVAGAPPETAAVPEADAGTASPVASSEVQPPVVKAPDAAALADKAAAALPEEGGAKTQAVGAVADDKPQAVGVEHFSFEIAVDNAIDGAIDLSLGAALGRQLVSKLEAKLFLGKLTMAGVLPRPLADVQLTTRLLQEHLANIDLSECQLRLPDYGSTVNLTAKAGIGPDYMPQRLAAKLTTQLVLNGEEKLPNDIKTSGRLGVDISLDSADMHILAVDGDAKFERFNLLIPAKDGKGPPTLVVDHMSGQIPFKQVVVLPDLKAKTVGEAKDVAASEAKPKAGDSVAGAEAGSSGAGSGEAKVAVIPVGDDGEAPPDPGAANFHQAVQSYLNKNDSKPMAGANVVAVVDYGTIRPFYPERRPLSIRKVEVANLELSDMEFDLELRQNWFALNQFVINFLGGKIEGDFQLAFDASNPNPKEILQSLRTSIHLTRLDSRKLLERFPNLKSQAASSDLFSNPYIDATIHLIFDMKSSDISGAVDISSIGKEQLRMILFYADPYEQNPTIADIRKTLAFGEVRSVELPLKNGEVGMDVDVRVLGAPIPTPKLTHFPISQLLQNFKDQSAASGAG